MQDLNAQQQAAVNFVNDPDAGSLNLVARAGTGKTATLVGGIVPAILEHANESVALMAFNKAAATEFEERLHKLGISNPRVATGTVHAFGLRMWRPAADRNLKVDGKKVYAIVDRKATQELIYRTHGSAIAKLVSYAKQHAFGVTCDIDDLGSWAHLVQHYDVECNGSEPEITDAAIETLKASNAQLRQVVDFDDMLLSPLLHNVKAKTFDWVLIDEAQDTNAARRLIALKLLAPNGRLVAVGDPRQAIYGFTGADSNALDLIKSIMGSAELPLSITYRCPKAVVAEANRIVPDLMAHESAPAGAVKAVAALTGPEGHQVPWFVTEKVTAADVALCRNTKQLMEQAYKMIRAGLGCRVEGRDIGEGLVALATKWKRVVTLGALADSLEDYKAREIEKWAGKKNDAKVQAVEDKVETLKVIIEHLLAQGCTAVADLVAHVRGLFGDTPAGEAARVFTFSTIHKSKGREWARVYFLFRSATLPSKYATQAWQLDQELNLEYVAITRAKEELIYVD